MAIALGSIQATVRNRLADATREIHEALHVHPLSLALLEARDQDTITAALHAALSFNHALEMQRQNHGCWPALELGDSLRALAIDLGSIRQAIHITLRLDSPHQVLGALYVAHGSQFGRQQIRAAIERHSEMATPNYYAMPVDRIGWQTLIDALEQAGADEIGFQALVQGAHSTFSAYRQALDLATPYTHRSAHTRT